MSAIDEITEQEIAAAMNFDAVLKMVRDSQAAKRTLRKMTAAGLIVAALVAGLLFWLWRPANRTPQVAVSTTSVPASTGSDEIKPPARENLKTDSSPRSTVPPNTKAHEKAANTEALKITPAVFIAAVPDGGFEGLAAYFGRELKYPAAAVKDSIKGTLKIRFTISTSGKAEEITLVNSLGAACDQEGIRVISNMPPWQPATLDGQKVPSKVTIPLYFIAGSRL